MRILKLLKKEVSKCWQFEKSQNEAENLLHLDGNRRALLVSYCSCPVPQAGKIFRNILALLNAGLRCSKLSEKKWMRLYCQTSEQWKNHHSKYIFFSSKLLWVFLFFFSFLCVAKIIILEGQQDFSHMAGQTGGEWPCHHLQLPVARMHKHTGFHHLP